MGIFKNKLKIYALKSKHKPGFNHENKNRFVIIEQICFYKVSKGLFANCVDYCIIKYDMSLNIYAQ